MSTKYYEHLKKHKFCSLQAFHCRAFLVEYLQHMDCGVTGIQMKLTKYNDSSSLLSPNAMQCNGSIGQD